MHCVQNAMHLPNANRWTKPAVDAGSWWHCEDVKWIKLAQDGEWWRILVVTMMRLWVLQKEGKFWSVEQWLHSHQWHILICFKQNSQYRESGSAYQSLLRTKWQNVLTLSHEWHDLGGGGEVTEHKKLLNTKSYWTQKITEHKKLLNTKSYWMQKVTERKNYWTQKVTEHKKSLNAKSYWRQKVTKQKILLNTKSYWTQKVTERKKLLNAKNYWTQKVTEHKKLLNKKITEHRKLLNTKSYWTQKVTEHKKLLNTNKGVLILSTTAR